MMGDSKAATDANVVVIPFRTPANLKDKKPGLHKQSIFVLIIIHFVQLPIKYFSQRNLYNFDSFLGGLLLEMYHPSNVFFFKNQHLATNTLEQCRYGSLEIPNY